MYNLPSAAQVWAALGSSCSDLTSPYSCIWTESIRQKGLHQKLAARDNMVFAKQLSVVCWAPACCPTAACPMLLWDVAAVTHQPILLQIRGSVCKRLKGRRQHATSGCLPGVLHMADCTICPMLPGFGLITPDSSLHTPWQQDSLYQT